LAQHKSKDSELESLRNQLAEAQQTAGANQNARQEADQHKARVKALEADLAKAQAANASTDDLRNQLQAAQKAAADEKESLQNDHQADIEEANKSSAAEIKRLKDELAAAQNSNENAKGLESDIESAEHDDTFVSKYLDGLWARILIGKRGWV